MTLITSLKLIFLVGLVHLSDSMVAKSFSVTKIFDQYKTAHLGEKGDYMRLLNVVLVVVSSGEVNLKQGGHKACTGTLIRDDLVITLASCVLLDVHEDIYPEFTVIYERPQGTILKVLEIFIDPYFRSDDRSFARLHDFALIVVEKSQQKDYAQLPKHFDNFGDIKKNCVFGGYGANENNTNLDSFRMYEMNDTKADVLEGRACLSGVCLHFHDIMPCEADFGSPLICNGVVYALYTPRFSGFRDNNSPKCLDFYVTAFSPLYTVKDWVAQYMDASISFLEWLKNPWYVFLVCCVVFVLMGGIYYGLVEFLQRTCFDPSESLEMGLARSTLTDDQSMREDGSGIWDAR